MTRAEKVIWLFFAATSCQLAFLQPSVVLAPGQRVNLFSGLLCLLSLIVALILARRGALKVKSPEFLVSAALIVLGVISALHSLTPLASFLRVFVLLASGLGGFWCARILLNTPENQRRFQWLCLFLLSGVVLLSLAGYFLTGQIHYYFFKGSNHPLADVIFLLSGAPLALLARKSRNSVLLGAVLLGLGYAVLCLSERLSVVFIPVGLGVLGVLFGALRWKHLLAALIVIAIIVGLSAPHILWFKLNKEYPYYRVENFFFSWSIAKQHPVLGIGLRAPREQFLDDYRLTYPYTAKEQFAEDVAGIVTADNQILTFLSGLGFPFTILYGLAVLTLLMKLIRLAWRPPPGSFFPPLALLFPLSLALVHFQLYDGLLFAQNSWFFHILLGLIPVGAAVPAVLEVPGAAADLSYSAGAPNLEGSGTERGKS
ncbi:MAG: hypothetical protein NTY36_09860 [Deltaproteobacteria bacterium]|nr:hypothetical protein [Deltaproteobacteria bacterium]